MVQHVGGTVPQWGFARILRALEGRRFSGVLEASLAEGLVTFVLDAGRIRSAWSALPALSVDIFLLRVRRDPSDLKSTPPPTRTGSTFQSLVAAGEVSLDEATRHQNLYARGLLGAVLPLALSDWKATTGIPADALLGEPVDTAAELVRVLSRNPDVFALRQALSRFAGGAALVVGPEASDLLVAATSVLPDAEVVKRTAPGQRREVDPGVLRDDASVRVLFALMACGCLATAAAGEVAAQTQAPAVTDSTSSTVMKELETTEQSFASSNLYDLLGIPIEARISQVERAYQRLKRRFTAGRFDVAGQAGAMACLERINSRLDDALRTLTDRDKRNSYNRSIGISAGIEAKLAHVFDSRAHFKTGQDLLAQRRPADALAQFEMAYKRDPKEPENNVAIARALLSGVPSQDSIGRARIMIDEALKADEELVGAHLVMATVCRLEEQKDKALEHIRIAARLDPENPEVKAARDSLGGGSRTSTQGFRKKESVFDKVRKILKMD